MSARGLTRKPAPTEANRIAALEAELHKLRTINEVLIERVEREMDPRADTAFSRLYHAVALESSVTQRTEALHSLTRRLMREINERRSIEAALQEAKEAAEKANLGKTSFLAAASHDLNQPLNAARLFLGALAAEIPQGSARGLVARIETALETMEHLLAELMEISRLDAGFLQAEIADFELQPLLEALHAEFQPQAAALGLEFRLVPTSAALRTDRHLLERVLRNLIGNAIRYTREGRILLGCRPRGRMVRLDVIDTGIGIPREKFATIFQEFHQLGNNPRGGEKGVGLGLAIVERIARLLDCRLDIESELGRGSRFSIHVPRGAGAAEAGGAAREQPMAAALDFSALLVVVIDNDRGVLEGMQTLLHSWHCRVIGAVSIPAAIAELDAETRPPDIIIADYHLDGGTYGTDAIASLQARYRRAIPSLVITSDSSPRLRADLRAAGHATLAKPLAPSRLRALMRHKLG